jgi:hypothetical protein
MVNSARIFPMGLVVAATTLAFAAGPGSAFADVPAPGPSVASSTRSLEQQDSPDSVVDEAPDYQEPEYEDWLQIVPADVEVGLTPAERADTYDCVNGVLVVLDPRTGKPLPPEQQEPNPPKCVFVIVDGSKYLSIMLLYPDGSPQVDTQGGPRLIPTTQPVPQSA